MNYEESINYIKKISKFGSVFGLETMKKFLARLGNPEKGLRFVHVAGTNGKGSTTAYLSSILTEQGYKTGTYISPSVFCYNERFMLDGKMISNDDLALYMTTAKDAVEEMKKEGENLPTAFEIETALALLYFKAKGADICVLETGLGGRLDATNAVDKKLLAVVTKIGMDHIQILGSSLKEIAAEKLAIVKGCPLCTVEQPSEVMPLVYSLSESYVAKGYELLSYSDKGQTFSFEGMKYDIPLLGRHQIENASLAVLSAKVLNSKGFTISDEAIYNGLKNTKWQGRFEIIDCVKGKLILDGAHNEDGAKALYSALCDYFPDRKIGAVMASFKDKEYQKTVEIISGAVDEIYTVNAEGERSLPAENLAEIASKFVKAKAFKNIQDAISKMFVHHDVVVVCGTLSILKEVKALPLETL